MMLPKIFKMGIPLGFLLILCTSVLNVAGNESRADRLQCWHCEGEGCEDPVPKDCAADLQDDHCYSLFDSYNDLVGMGCLSDFETQDEIVQLTKQKLLFKCDGANCNDYNNWPGTNICTRCSSANDLDCVFGPERVTTTETCSQTPYTHCYERVNKATGATERGCLYDLENEDFYACLTDEKGEGCSVCLGANCNRGIVPATRAQCHRCDSTSDARCEAAPRSLSVCPTYVANDMCVSFYENDVVRRGCASELSCDGNAKNCDKCRGEGCNTVNIKQRSKEVYGMFQELPLNCNTCDGVDDCKTGIFKPRKCEGDKYQDCMSVFNNDKQLLRRGCENDVVAVYAEHCDKYPELCFKCKSNGCNNIVTPDNYQECLYCDAKSNPDCLFKPESIETTRKCVEGCLSSLYPRSDDPTVYDFVRACAEDIENDDREICAQAKNCESCKDSNECNTAILPAEGRLSCLYCNGADCNQPQSRQCVSYSADDQCYMFFDNVTNSAIHAGCVSDLQRRDVQADIKQYFLCDGDNCNSFSNLPDARMCFECNSATDENCAINPLAATLRRCQITPYTDCYTRVLPNGHTERGCLQSLPIDDFVECTDGDESPKCQKCSESRCNGNIFPSGRQSCYRCDSSVDASCQTSPSQAQVCPVYKAQDSCVTKLVGETTLRGCGSELDCSDSNAKNCVSCTGDNCNNVNLVVEDIGPPGLFQGLPLNCYHCGDDVDCWVSKGQLKKCEGNNLQTCTVAFGANGNVVQRGCSDLVESTCMEAGNSCYDCKSNGCNTAERTSDYIDCLFCDAQQNSNCVFNVSGVTRTRKCQSGCITALYPRNKDDKKPVHELTRTCWDDLDLDDREACLAGTLETCKACTTPNCNTADVGDRLSCYQCEGENCQDPQVHECRGVLERDQCIIEFDETSSVALLGCKSRYDEAELELRIREQRLWICEGANCNTLDALPSSQRCSLCSSLTDEKCAISPNEVTTSTLCANVPTTQCYSRILKSGHTERGCASSLVGEDYYDCYMGSNANCTICSGASCNVQVFPQGRRSCHVCNSQSDATCKNSPNSPQVCLLYSPNEQCVTSIEVDTVKRGCSSQLKCDASDSENCRLCDGDNCNNDNVVVEDIGPPGLFQGLPLNCYHCDNDVDCWISKGQIKKCEGNNLQTCTVAFNATGGVAQRGCSDAVKSTCRESGINCYECKSNGCNTAERTSDFIDCLFCDAQQDPDCVFNVNAITRTRKCQSGCITALYLRNKNDTHPVHELTRTCWDDLDLDDREACLEGTLETCKACTTPNCNTADVGERLSCYHCSGENCQDPQPQQCRGVLANDQCIIEFDETNSISALGCKSQYDEDELKLRISEQRLWICEGANCNTIDALPSAQPCALCSSLTDSNCAISPNQVTSSTNCAKVPVTQCYTRVLKSGHTERGCASSLVGDDYYDCYAGSNENCTICAGARCNVQLFPQARRSCHVCNSQTSEACETTPNTPQVCLLYSPNEQCVTSIDEYDTVRRGCSSQLTCDVSDTENCRVCDSDNCNKLNIRRQADGKPGLWQALPLSCHTCDNEAACNTAPIPTTTCGDNDYCMTVFGENGKVEMRGCSSTVDAVKGEYCDQDSDKCSNCNSNDCNNAFSLDDFVECVYCDSITNKNCVLQPNEVTKTRRCQKQCMTALWQRPNSTAYELVRSCLDDKDKADQEACTGDKCTACSGTKCNTDMLPENRLSCYKCDNCEDFEPQVCSGYREDDQCYLLFEENDITRMGCLSDLDDAYLNANINKMFTCKDNLCNEPSNLPQPQVCVVCNSFTDEDCAVDATKVPSVTTCATLPNTHCYTKVDTNGQTLRGCVSDLSDSESSSCLAGSSATCKACTGDRCNIEVFPATRRTCHRCNSKEDPSCARSPNAVSACPRYVENDGCSAKLVNGYVYRGCSSEFTCDDEDKQYCRNCANKNNCNTVDLESLVIGYPGRWDTPPISCYKCIDSECSNNNLGSLTQCNAENEYQNCATVFDGNNNIIQRGCSDDIYNGKYGQWCDEQAGKCQFCKSGACNSATSINDYVDCIACDGKGNAECALNPTPALGTRRCHKSCFSALYPRRNETNPAHEMDRNCLDDLPVDLQAKCGTSDMPNCRKCDGNNCNTAAVPATRKTCFFCPDGDCSKPARVQTCTAYRENEQCYTMFDDEGAPLLKGCLSDLDTSFIEPHTRYIFKCDENNCNTDANYPEPKSCYYCNSTTNAGCITNTGMLDAVVCDLLPYTNCFTKVFDDGRTERGCQSDLGIDEFTECLDPDSKTCQICSSNSCNSGVFPADRRSCLRCDSGKDADCETNPSGFGGLCPLYAPNQRCVVKVEGDRLVRGCDTEVFCDPNNSQGCSYCEGDNCNTENLQVGSIGEPGKWQGLPLSCHKCDGAECLNGMVLPVSKCEGNNNQNCVVVFDANDKVTKRDCSDNVDAAYCAANPERCVSCKSNACNNYDIETVQQFVECYFCDSATNSDCAVNPSAISRTRKCKSCMTALYPRSSSNDTAYEISRSCLDDKEMDAQAECADGKDAKCQACSGPLCNGLTFPEDRLECYKCSGDCEDPQIEKCSAYAPDDQCFILVDTEDNSIVLHGCRSDFEPEQVEGLIKQKQMILFDGNASNAPESLPTVKQCKICNSAEDPRCATNPNLVPSTTRCSNFPYTNCYTRVNDDGTTDRGCLYSLSNDDFYQCLTGNSTLCSACDSNNCNAIDVFPANRLRCQQCDSATDPDCRLKPDSNIVCPLYDARDSCVTTLRDGEIVRGCSSNIQCDDPSDLTTCRTCNTNGCNTQILVGVDEDAGVPGRWTATPLTCHTCLGAEECAASLGGFRKCENNPLQNCVTVFDDNDVVLQRGCSDTIIPDYVGWCSDKKELCPRCNSNGCNTAKSLTEYIDCWACDVSKDPNCLYNLGALTKTRKCRESCMTAMYKREDEPNPAYVLARDCLDELDLDDREACEAGEFENCQACSTEKCNTATVPETRLSCYHCSGDGCQAPVARQCPFVRENDKCFIRFDERNEIVEQGCRSAYSNAEADYQLAKKYITYCDGDNCNTIESLPPPQTCTLCNSRTDVNCAIDSESVQSVTTCNISPYTHCYSRVLSDGATERGCLQSLYDNEFLNCLDNQSGNCTVCLGAKCNNKLFPETRLSCHTCDSVIDPTCERNPNSLTVCPKYQSDDQCVTSYANEITRRGCASNIDCDSTNPRGCVRCDGDGCNTVNLAIIQDDNYGKWQDLPLSCWTCDGAGCDALVKPERCENNNEQDCVSVFDATGKVIRRGCSDAVEATHGEWCAANKDNCPICKSNDCNQVTEKSQLVECLYCDSRKDSSCVSNPLTGKTRWCQGGCMTALYPTDGSTDPAYELIRTCLNDKEAEDRTECAEGKDAQCAACMTGKCNTAVVPADRRSCYTCNGANCENPQAQLCPVHKPNDKCFIWFDENNDVSEMGCVAKLGQQSLEDILKTKRVTVCDGDNCNVLEIPAPQRCAACNTTTDFNCAVNPTGISTFNTCNQLPYTHCYSRLSEDGNTGRGCLYDLPANQFAACLLGDDKNCGLCLGEGCNREIFPENRKRCFTCSSEDDDTCESDPNQTAVCPYERDSETCITALSGNVTIRGCSSLVYCDATQTQTCRSCTRSECNSIDLLNKVYDDYQGYWQDLPLRCHTCEDEQCDYSLGPALTCQGTVQQECMTVFNATGDVIRRGCEDDVESEFSKWCNTHKDHCYKCKSNECNDVWTRDDYVQCAYCLSSKDPLCATRPNSVFPRHCNRDCLVAMRDGEIIRSCLDDKEVQDRYVCRGAVNSTECASCDSDNCNTFVYPSDRLSCHVCTGTSCSSSVPEYCSKYDKSDSCFAKYENGKLDLMGCVSGQNASDIEKWRAEKRLYECEGNNCNQLSLLPESSQCLSCDSSKNPNCAQNPMLVVQYETCAALSDECLTWLDTAGHTLRACVSSIPDDVVSSCTSAGSCAVCKGSRCNKDVFPANRRKCHICATSQSDDKCVNAPESLAVCPIYAANDQCYSKKNSDDSVQRGCVSDASNCAGDECQKCNTDGCNTVDLTGSAALATASVVLTMLLASIAMLLSNVH